MRKINVNKWTMGLVAAGVVSLSFVASGNDVDFDSFKSLVLDKQAPTHVQQPDKVKITAADTELEFSIAGIKSIPCTGNMNIPDGECFTAPVKDSVNGHIHFNSATIYRGTPFDDIRLTFEKGKVVSYSSSNDEALGKILDSDDGARYFGEFALGFHPFITSPMRDILFDEKIAGSFHFTPGQAYEDADNGNRSAVHWDMVMIQTPDNGGGAIEFDGTVIRQDGRFILSELDGLNPEHLK